MLESFSDFVKGKKKRTNLPRNKPLEDVYDEHIDQVMHHLHAAHKLTHPDGHLHRAVEKMGHSAEPVSEFHADLEALLKKHGGK